MMEATPHTMPSGLGREVIALVEKYCHFPYVAYTEHVAALSLEELLKPLDLTAHPPMTSPREIEPLYGVVEYFARAIPAEERDGEAWSETLDVGEESLQVVFEGLEVFRRLKKMDVFERVMAEEIPDPWPDHLRPLDILLTRESILATPAIAPDRPFGPTTLRCLTEQAKGFRMKKIKNDSPPLPKCDPTEVLDLLPRYEPETFQKARDLFLGTVGTLKALLAKQEEGSDAEEIWARWEGETTSALNVIPRPIEPPLFPIHRVIDPSLSVDSLSQVTPLLRQLSSASMQIRIDDGASLDALLAASGAVQSVVSSSDGDDVEKAATSLDLMDEFEDINLVSPNPTSPPSLPPRPRRSSRATRKAAADKEAALLSAELEDDQFPWEQDLQRLEPPLLPMNHPVFDPLDQGHFGMRYEPIALSSPYSSGRSRHFSAHEARDAMLPPPAREQYHREQDDEDPGDMTMPYTLGHATEWSAGHVSRSDLSRTPRRESYEQRVKASKVEEPLMQRQEDDARYPTEMLGDLYSARPAPISPQAPAITPRYVTSRSNTETWSAEHENDQSLHLERPRSSAMSIEHASDYGAMQEEDPPGGLRSSVEAVSDGLDDPDEVKGYELTQVYHPEVPREWIAHKRQLDAEPSAPHETSKRARPSYPESPAADIRDLDASNPLNRLVAKRQPSSQVNGPADGATSSHTSLTGKRYDLETFLQLQGAQDSSLTMPFREKRITSHPANKPVFEPITPPPMSPPDSWKTDPLLANPRWYEDLASKSAPQQASASVRVLASMEVIKQRYLTRALQDADFDLVEHDTAMQGADLALCPQRAVLFRRLSLLPTEQRAFVAAIQTALAYYDHVLLVFEVMHYGSFDKLKAGADPEVQPLTPAVRNALPSFKRNVAIAQDASRGEGNPGGSVEVIFAKRGAGEVATVMRRWMEGELDRRASRSGGEDRQWLDAEQAEEEEEQLATVGLSTFAARCALHTFGTMHNLIWGADETQRRQALAPILGERLIARFNSRIKEELEAADSIAADAHIGETGDAD